MADDLSQLPAPGIGEVYRLLVRLEQRINELSAELRSKVVTLDVYQIAHNNLQDKVQENRTELDHHLVEHAEQAKDKDRAGVQLLAASITSGVALLVGVCSIIVGIVH